MIRGPTLPPLAMDMMWHASVLTSVMYKQGATTLGDLTYTYDAAGNRIKTGGTFARSNISPALTTTSYNANNQQTTFGTSTETFDLNGNLATTTDAGVTTTYTWNARNQLTDISKTGFTASFTYDSFDRRTGRTVNGVVTNYVYDGLNPVQEKNGGTVTANLLTGLGIDEFFTRTDSVGVRSLLSDALESTVALGDGTGTLQTQYTYEPFGFVSQTGAASTSSYKFTGREDDGTEVMYYRARYYNPRLQRFIAEDPLVFAGGNANIYLYVANNPTRWRDPSGLFFGGSDGYLTYPLDFIGGLGDLARGRSNMMDAGTVGADAYFHCRANWQASRRGLGGYNAALLGSWLREVYQMEAASDRARDEAANAQGQRAGSCNPGVDCYRACANLIPPWGIPQRHLPPHADPVHIYQP